jgi:hypothetical protein
VFLGHAAFGFAAKRAAPRVSLGWLLLAPWALDLLWPLFLLAGVERVRIAPGNTAFTPLDFTWYPWSHSLAMSLVWSAAAAALYAARAHDRRGAWILGALVTSHWFLDAIAHRADLPLAPGLPARVGLGLWNSVPATLAVEGGLFVAGLAAYATGTRARDRVGRFAWWGLVVFLVVIYASNLGGPPPPSPSAIAWVTLVFGALIGPWGAWIDRHRVVTTAAA